MVWTAITVSATAVWNAISAGWNWLVGFLSPIFSGIGSAGAAVWHVISDVANGVVGTIKGIWEGLGKFFSGLWDGISKAGTAAWDAIGTAIGKVTSVISGIWDKITGAVKAVWNFIAKGWNSIPSIHVPDWVPVIGGSDFGLPKLPVLWHGGEAPGGRALVGEHGPEPLVVGGQLAGIVGASGPEVTSIPRGGYVVPNLNTLNALPGLAKSLPPSVAAAVARSVPGYAGALGQSGGGRGDSGLRDAVNRLAGAVAGQMPPVTINGNGDVRKEALEAWRAFQRERDAHSRYEYSSGGG